MEPPIPPPIIDYNKPPEPYVATFLLGVAIGAVISWFIWVVGWDRVQRDRGHFVMIAVPVSKCTLAVFLARRQKLRGLAAGLVTSVPLGALIFGFAALTDWVTHCRIT